MEKRKKTPSSAATYFRGQGLRYDLIEKTSQKCEQKTSTFAKFEAFVFFGPSVFRCNTQNQKKLRNDFPRKGTAERRLDVKNPVESSRVKSVWFSEKSYMLQFSIIVTYQNSNKKNKNKILVSRFYKSNARLLKKTSG